MTDEKVVCSERVQRKSGRSGEPNLDDAVASNGVNTDTQRARSRHARRLLSISQLSPSPHLLPPAMVAKTRGGAQPSPKKLKFHDKLVGKGLSTDTLLKKLKTLHTELADLDQETVDTSTLGGPRKELIHQTILLHKDRGVKAYAACCLADLLRLYAPDAPYTHHELRDIFQFFFRQLSAGLTGPDAPYYNEYFHLLESLSTVKSVVLVCDLPNSDELMVDIFRSSFNLVRLDLAKKVEMFLADILVALIDESHTLPSELLETILAQFKDRKSVSCVYDLRLSFCGACSAFELVNKVSPMTHTIRFLERFGSDLVPERSSFASIRVSPLCGGPHS